MSWPTSRRVPCKQNHSDRQTIPDPLQREPSGESGAEMIKPGKTMHPDRGRSPGYLRRVATQKHKRLSADWPPLDQALQDVVNQLRGSVPDGAERQVTSVVREPGRGVVALAGHSESHEGRVRWGWVERKNQVARDIGRGARYYIGLGANQPQVDLAVGSNLRLSATAEEWLHLRFPIGRTTRSRRFVSTAERRYERQYRAASTCSLGHAGQENFGQ